MKKSILRVVAVMAVMVLMASGVAWASAPEVGAALILGNTVVDLNALANPDLEAVQTLINGLIAEQGLGMGDLWYRNAAGEDFINVADGAALSEDEALAEVGTYVTADLEEVALVDPEAEAEAAVAAYEAAPLTTLEEIEAAKALKETAVEAVTAVEDETVKAELEARIAAQDEIVVAAELDLTELVVESVTAVKAKQIEVVFNKPVAEDSSLTVRRDSAPVSVTAVEWNEDRTVATLTTSINLITGDYVVTVTQDDVVLATSEATELEASRVAEIRFLSDMAVRTGANTATTTVKVYNQYGEDITKTAISSVQFTPSIQGTVSPQGVNGTILVTKTDPFIDEQVFVITAVHPASGTAASKMLTLASAVEIASIEIGELTTDRSSSDIYVSTDLASYDYWLPLTVYDQYGNEIIDTNVLANELTIFSSNNHIINGVGVTIVTKNDKPALLLADGTATETYGTAVLTLVSKSGATASKGITVLSDPVVDVFTIMHPDVVVKETVEFELPFEAYDQYGNKLVKSAYLPSSDTSYANSVTVGGVVITVTGGQIKADTDYVNGNLRILKVKPNEGVSQLIVTVVTPTAKTQTLTMAVQDKPVAMTIGGVHPYMYTKLQAGQSTSSYTTSPLLYDQYGDRVALDSTIRDVIIEQVDPSNTNVVFNGTDTFTAATATTSGSTQFRYKLIDKTTGNVLDEYTFTMESVALKDVEEFVISMSSGNKIYSNVSAAATHQKPFKIVGKKDGASVLVDQGLIKDAFVTDGLTVSGQYVVPENVNTYGAWKTATLTVVVEGYYGPETLTYELEYNDAAPKADFLYPYDKWYYSELTSGIATMSGLHNKKIGPDGNARYIFLSKDQYGVSLVGTDVTYIVTNKSFANAGTNVVVGADGTVTFTGAPVAGDSFVVTAYADGLSATMTIVLTADEVIVP